MRYASIDLLRTFAIALMTLVHFLENLAGSLWTPAGFGAPLFAFLAGVNFRIWELSQERKGRSPADIAKAATRRGLFLFALGFAFNFFVWLPEDLYNWDVLTMLGATLGALAFARTLPSGFLAFVAALLYALAPFLRNLADYQSHWSNGYFECEHELSEILAGFVATGYFPIFPWAAFPLVGYLAGKHLFPDHDERPDAPRALRPLFAAGAGGALAAAALRWGGPWLPAPIHPTLVNGWTMFPASPEYVAAALGFALLGFATLHHFVDRRGALARFPRALSVAGTMSRHSLTMYLLHHVLHLWPLWMFGLVRTGEPTHYWRIAMPVWAAVALVGVCLVVCCLLFRWMERRERPGAETLMRWLCD